MKYNLLGQKGPEGQTNPAAPEGGPYIYDEAPGLKDGVPSPDAENKGLSAKGKPVDEKQHQEKIESVVVQESQDTTQVTQDNKQYSSSYTVEQIMDYQTILNSMGFDPGPIDGILGEKTRKAIRLALASDTPKVTYALNANGYALRSAFSDMRATKGNVYGSDLSPTSTPTPTTTPTTTTPTTTSTTPSTTSTLSPTSSPGQASEQSSQLVDSGQKDFLNIPENAFLWDVDGTLYLAYEVPGSGGEVYDGEPMYMAYTVVENDLVKAGLISPEAPVPTVNRTMPKELFDSTTIVFGNTDQLTSEIDNPFASFKETVSEQAQVAPWIKDPEMLSLIAEAALEGRVVSDAEWQSTTWYQTNNESQREWLRTFYADPTTAAQLKTDAELAVANSLRAAGVSNAPQSVSNWMASKFVSGEWSDAYTSEQITLFADPYAPGIKDSAFQTYLDTVSLTGLDRTTEKEREVGELYTTWLGPTLGALTDDEKADIAGKLRSDPDYQDKLIESLKQSRLAAFSNYTNPELTYEDIARPWRNLTTSVWGQTADETQGWWQEMVKTNDFAKAQTTLREKGLEQDVTQVTQDATQALQQAFGQGTVSQTGVNV